MAFVPVPNNVEVQVVYEMDSQIVENTLYFQHSGPITGTEITALLTAIRTAIVTDLIPLISDSIKLVRLIGTLLDAVDAISVVMAVIPAVPGTLASSTSLPNDVAYAVQFKTDQRGRSFRGRNFVAGIPTGVRVGINQVASSYRDSLLAAYTNIGTAGVDDGWVHTVVSRYHNKAPRVTGVATPVSAYTSADLVLDSQRRRLPGRGA